MNEMTLREIRLKLGMTMDEMAEEINVPKSSYSYWGSKNTFCQINPLDKKSWKVKTENKVIVWK